MPTPDPASASSGSVSRWIRAHPYRVAFVVGTLVMLGLVARKKGLTEFEHVFVLSGTHLMHGRGLYRLPYPPGQRYTYPPFQALLSAPFATLPGTPGRWLWTLLNLGCLAAVGRGCWRLSGGGRLEGEGPPIARREHLIAGFGLACALPALLGAIDHQQTDVVIAALLVGGCLLLSGRRALGAATCFGLAAAMKCTPLLFAPYLAWRGHWKAALWLVAVAVGVNLLPDLLPARAGCQSWLLVEWCRTFLEPMTHSSYHPGKWYAWILDNQSISGAATRWVTTRLDGASGVFEIVDRSRPLLGTATVRALVALAELGLLLGAWRVLGRPGPLTARETDVAPGRAAFEYSMVFLLMLLLSPMSSRTHFGTILLPCLCLARVSLRDDRRARIALGLALVVGIIPLLGKNAGRVWMWYGVYSWTTLVLLAGCAWALAATRRALPAPALEGFPANHLGTFLRRLRNVEHAGYDRTRRRPR